ncbi:hypothetical protein [Desulfosporosinus youngiae]|uniref:DUF4352 domain-containing protein n=1 Tax=Desulfosporosinus youngiae DSM 17734 TaxID=768710 RepID=H5Y4X7_9FIRM|nr:hypothetical protein [Desulfosporosinus youngiae]EHQ90012.1 hypothetical protein DesyoDRAFT_2966 [Desulfosporosinus youngiae DSM 17734]
MAKIITINRKYIVMVVSVFVLCLIGFAAFSLGENKMASVSKDNGTPEIKMIGVAVEPASIVKDLTYGSVSLKGSQVISTNTFDLIVTVQNMTAKQMTNVPVELQVSLIGDEAKKVISPGSLKTLEPGATARVAFRQIKALGDASGKSGTDGQHLITFKINPNPEGGLEQATEASFRFNVDTTVKVPATVNKQ